MLRPEIRDSFIRLKLEMLIDMTEEKEHGKDKVINHQDVPYRVLERKYSYDEDRQHDENNGSESLCPGITLLLQADTGSGCNN